MDPSESIEIIEASLSQAFILPSSRRQSLLHSPAADTESAESIPVDNKPSEGAVDNGDQSQEAVADDSWKQEYEVQVQSWRAQSAEAREKAEKERARWEAIRAAEREKAARQKAVVIVDEPRASGSRQEEGSWENVGVRLENSTQNSSIQGSPHPAEQTGGGSADVHRSHSQQDTMDDSQKWEDVQASVTSSFPSMSFPERTETPSPLRQPTTAQPAPSSATLAIFDPSLSTRTRVVALLSSLAINLALPFINGVMLGFGEIFAKNFVMGWLGWGSAGPGTVATAAGLRSTREQRQNQYR